MTYKLVKMREEQNSDVFFQLLYMGQKTIALKCNASQLLVYRMI